MKKPPEGCPAAFWIFGGEGLLGKRIFGELGYGFVGGALDGIGQGAVPGGGELVEVGEGFGTDAGEVNAAAFAGGSGSGGAQAGLACFGKLGICGGGWLWLAHCLSGRCAPAGVKTCGRVCFGVTVLTLLTAISAAR